MAAAAVCEGLLRVARSMLAAMAAARDSGAGDLHCRIGIGAGPVLAGVLGLLQPRFHIFGQARACFAHMFLIDYNTAACSIAALHNQNPATCAD